MSGRGEYELNGTRIRQTLRSVGKMVQKLQRLTALAINRVSEPGLYADGGGLYLRVGRKGAKRWAFRFTLNNRPHEMGFGGLNKVSLVDARKKASDARLLLSEGRNPLIHRQEIQTERAAAEKTRSKTFDQCAELYITAHELAWKTKSIGSSGETRSRLMFRPFSAPTPCRRSISKTTPLQGQRRH